MFDILTLTKFLSLTWSYIPFGLLIKYVSWILAPDLVRFNWIVSEEVPVTFSPPSCFCCFSFRFSSEIEMIYYGCNSNNLCNKPNLQNNNNLECTSNSKIIVVYIHQGHVITAENINKIWFMSEKYLLRRIQKYQKLRNLSWNRLCIWTWLLTFSS